MDVALAPADPARRPGLPLTAARVRCMHPGGAVPLVRRRSDRPGRCRSPGQIRPVLVTGSVGGARSAAPDPASEPPGWLLELAGTAKQMTVPDLMRPPRGGGRRSAILILFGAGSAGPDVLLVQRSQSLRRHAGQPAFPGGAVDADDDGPVAAALREAAEEARVDPAGVR